MKLIADSGGSKTAWALIREEAVIKEGETIGYNPFSTDVLTIKQDVQENVLNILGVEQEKVDEFVLYSAGCGNDVGVEMLAGTIRAVFENRVTVYSDLLGACQGACMGENGVVSILGTGSNACVFDGVNIVQKGLSLGHLLGDEGSGFKLGQRIIRAYLYGELDDKLTKLFESYFEISTKQELISTVYKSANQKQYIASFSIFYSLYKENEVVMSFLKAEIVTFLEQHILKFRGIYDMPLHFVGSIGYEFQDVIIEILQEYDLKHGRFLKSPLENLKAWHFKN